MDKRVDKIQELMKDEAFVKELFSKQDPEDVQALFDAKGVELSLDEIKQIGTMLKKVASGEVSAEQLEKAANGELSEEELEDVAGGFAIIATITTVVITGAVAGGSAYGGYKLMESISDGSLGEAASAVGDAFSSAWDSVRSWGW